jgi:excisionase family DNA binding protein
MSTTVKPSQFTPLEQEVVAELRDLLAPERMPQATEIRIGGRSLELPEPTRRLFAEVVESLAEGHPVTLVTGDVEGDEISPKEAAAILGVSRPFASRLFDEGAIPCRRVGTHRRALRSDVMAYRERERAERKRVLDELAAEGQRLNLGY